ncbi:MAG: mechanosensitive ion channel [Prevotellaceae bacterium]|jgi:small conductance mechanosensitive channel|nr:mechanosensitive ion channel [Prevotellaceae bacterium]
MLDSFTVDKLIDLSISVGGRILAAILIFIVGRFLISLINKLVAKLLVKRSVDAGVQSFVKSLVNILLMILLIVAIISKLGIETTSFAALLASAGVAVGMALSGNLQNFAGGLILLVLRPFKVGDFIECQGVSGSVREIQIFHTILTTPDNKVVFVPNGALSGGTIVNYSKEDTRRVDWTIGVDYGEDFDKVESTVRTLLASDARILQTPAPYVALHTLNSSSVDVVIRVWVKSSDYWDVYHHINKTVYATFNKEGIDFPFPQLTVHQAKD